MKIIILTFLSDKGKFLFNQYLFIITTMTIDPLSIKIQSFKSIKLIN
jgi:hypothetical protein